MDDVDTHKREFIDFLESDDNDGRYIQKLKQCIADQTFRLVVNVNDLRNFRPELASR
jgi:hypothetical protein